MKFSELGVSTAINKGLQAIGITVPTKIQEQAIPILLKESIDFVGKAQTGTGKTAAFGIPLLSKVDSQKQHVQAVILAPTRELGQQIAKQLFRFTKYTDKIYVEAVYGGEKIEKQIKRLQRPTHIIVATPGRLIDLMDKKVVNISKIHTVVLDEADEMLSMGFKKELNSILSRTKGRRNIWLFSATIPSSLDEIINTYVQKDAVRITVDRKSKVNKNIDHQFVIGEEAHKLDTLCYFLKSQKSNAGIVFTKTKAAARKLSKQLLAKNYQTGLIEGDMTQKERDKVMRAFKSQKLQLLVATDVAARGIDVSDLAFVVHYQLPDDLAYYTHRSGRTARAGNTGISLALIVSKELKVIRTIEKELDIQFTQIR